MLGLLLLGRKKEWLDTMTFMQPLSLENLVSREQKKQVSNCLTVRAIKWKVSLSNFISYGETVEEAKKRLTGEE